MKKMVHCKELKKFASSSHLIWIMGLYTFILKGTDQYHIKPCLKFKTRYMHITCILHIWSGHQISFICNNDCDWVSSVSSALTLIWFSPILKILLFIFEGTIKKIINWRNSEKLSKKPRFATIITQILCNMSHPTDYGYRISTTYMGQFPQSAIALPPLKKKKWSCIRFHQELCAAYQSTVMSLLEAPGAQTTLRALVFLLCMAGNRPGAKIQ